jgi:hypothetical protein
VEPTLEEMIPLSDFKKIPCNRFKSSLIKIAMAKILWLFLNMGKLFYFAKKPQDNKDFEAV